MTWTPVFSLLIAYLAGSVPTGYLAGKWFHGIDIREHGSKNLGATNVFRVLGWKTGLPVMLIDIAKGYLPVLLASAVMGSAPEDQPLLIATGLVAVLGHVFTIFLKFKGGKGVATAAGAFLGLMPGAFGLALAIFILVVAITRYVSLGSILAATSLFIAEWLIFCGTPWQIGFAGMIMVFIVYTHRANIGRLIKGTENKLTFGKK